MCVSLFIFVCNLLCRLSPSVVTPLFIRFTYSLPHSVQLSTQSHLVVTGDAHGKRFIFMSAAATMVTRLSMNIRNTLDCATRISFPLFPYPSEHESRKIWRWLIWIRVWYCCVYYFFLVVGPNMDVISKVSPLFCDLMLTLSFGWASRGCLRNLAPWYCCSLRFSPEVE